MARSMDGGRCLEWEMVVSCSELDQCATRTDEQQKLVRVNHCLLQASAGH